MPKYASSSSYCVSALRLGGRSSVAILFLKGLFVAGAIVGEEVPVGEKRVLMLLVDETGEATGIGYEMAGEPIDPLVAVLVPVRRRSA